MIFRDEKHNDDYVNLIDMMKAENDVERKALAYLITADTVCNRHIKRIYDFENRCIIPECLNEEWNTQTSLKTIKLAFNLFNGGTMWADDTESITPFNIFDSELLSYYIQALQIRFNQTK